MAGFGGIWLCLWRRPVRWAGGAGILAGLLSVALTVPPDILIDGSGRLIAVRTASGGLSLSSKRVEKFAAQIWLERDGEEDATAWPATESGDGRLSCDSIGCLYRAGGRTVALVRDERAFDEDCVAGAVVVSTVPARWHCRGADRVVDRFDLWREGAHAIWLGSGGVRVLSVRQARGDRLWTRAPPDQARRTVRAEAVQKAKGRGAGNAPARVSTAASARQGGPAP